MEETVFKESILTEGMYCLIIMITSLKCSPYFDRRMMRLFQGKQADCKNVSRFFWVVPHFPIDHLHQCSRAARAPILVNTSSMILHRSFLFWENVPKRDKVALQQPRPTARTLRLFTVS